MRILKKENVEIVLTLLKYRIFSFIEIEFVIIWSYINYTIIGQ